MRLLHTSDWHLGRRFHGAGLLDEQVAAVDAMVEMVRTEAVDAVLIAGDLYDRQIPPADAVAVLSEALYRLRSAGAAVVAISGNHDSAARLRFGDSLLSPAGVHLRTDVLGAATPVVVPARDGGPDLAVYAVPYLEPEMARHRLEAPEARSHEAVLRLTLDRARADLAARRPMRSVAMAHAFVSGGQPCDSERVLRIGGADRVSLGCFDGFDYVALGHLHGRQVLADGRMRYAGSPVPYSFSERHSPKSVEIVDLAADGTVRVQRADLPASRPLCQVRGSLDELLASERWSSAEDAWVAAVLTDQVLPREAMARLRQRFKWAVTLQHEPPTAAGAGASYRERVAACADDLSLVERFVGDVTGAALDGGGRQLCAAVIDDVTRSEPAA